MRIFFQRSNNGKDLKFPIISALSDSTVQMDRRRSRLIIATEIAIATNGTVRKRRRLGGMLNFYYREAA
jgi:hypothetical protein